MPETPLGDQRQRIDKWLFFARITKSRALAQDLVAAGKVRINGQVVMQASRLVKAGDRLEIQLERRDLVAVVVAGGSRRGPPSEARLLYSDQTPDTPVPLTPFERAQRRLDGKD
jgi:ribosome-associated heat shock protein Hsp15